MAENQAYRIKSDVSIHRVVAEVKHGDETTYEVEGVNYPAGSYVLAKHMTPRDRARAQNGELDHLLHPVSREEAEAGIQGGGEPEVGVFVAEHEAEAHALDQAGHVVVPKEQVLEAQSAGAEWAAQYQQAAHEHGLDHRPAQESMAAERPRIPSELLTNGETRTGAPYDPSPASDAVEPVSDGEDQVTPRPRPGSESVDSDAGSEGTTEQ